MKQFILISISVFFIVVTATAQNNKVSNSDFSIKDPTRGCPNTTGFSSGRPLGWFDDPFNFHSPDYFHPCNPPPIPPADHTAYSPGLNQNGCEYPLAGTAYVGAMAFLRSNPSDGSEYFGTVTGSLTAGQQYYIEFWVSSGDKANVNTYVKNLGMFLTQDMSKLNQPGGQGAVGTGLHHLLPQIPNSPNFPAANAYTTENGWQKISGFFTPSVGGPWNIIIGNFDPGINQGNPNVTFKGGVAPPAGQEALSYYFFDAVTIQASNLPLPVRLPYVTSPALICTSAAFTLNNSPVGASVTWAVSPTSYLTPASGSGSTANVTRIGIGKSTITFKVSGCTNQDRYYASALTHAGPYGSSDYPITGPSFAMCNQNVFYTMPTLPGTTSITWAFPSQWTLVSGQGTTQLTLNTGSNSSYGNLVQGGVNNTCGPSGSFASKFTQVDGGCGFGFAASPNPSTDELTVSFMNSEGTAVEKDFETANEVSLVNHNQERVWVVNSAKSSIVIPVKNLPNGLYILAVTTKDGTTKQQVLIEHK